MHMWNYLRACLASKFIGVHVLSHVQVRVKVKHPSCTRVAMYARASPVSLLVCIFSRVLSLALEQHASFRKNVTEMNASLMCACVKFRLSCTIFNQSYKVQIMSLVICGLGGGHTHAHKCTLTHT